MATYQQKKDDCVKRMIEFNFSETEWNAFQKLKNKVKCAYTGEKFVTKNHNHTRYPTLERINDLLPYCVENCVWVTREANTIKGYIQHGVKRELTQNESEKMIRIERILNNVEFLNKIQEPYLSLKDKNKKEVTIKKCTRNSEITIAKLYSQFGDVIEQQTDVDFELTFTEFKRMVSRKNCSLTGRPLPEDIFEMGFFIPNKRMAVSKTNCFVTTKTIQTALDTFTASCKLTSVELKVLCKSLL